jgi:hypothetical protein
MIGKFDSISEPSVLNVEAVRNSIKLDTETTVALQEANKKIKEKNEKYDFQVIVHFRLPFSKSHHLNRI